MQLLQFRKYLFKNDTENRNPFPSHFIFLLSYKINELKNSLPPNNWRLESTERENDTFLVSVIFNWHIWNRGFMAYVSQITREIFTEINCSVLIALQNIFWIISHTSPKQCNRATNTQMVTECEYNKHTIKEREL